MKTTTHHQLNPPPDEPDPIYFSVSQAAQRLGVSKKTLRRRISDGTIPAVRVGRLIRIKSDDLRNVGAPITAVPNALRRPGHKVGGGVK